MVIPIQVEPIELFFIRFFIMADYVIAIFDGNIF